MRRLALITLVSLLVCASPKVYCQAAGDSLTTKYVYCELVGTAKFLSTKVTVSVDYGEEKSFFQDTRVRDEQTGKVAAFNSMVDALNYMGTKGWEFVQAYVVTTSNQNVYRWLLKKKKNS
ncbi:MAG: hypothetical protein WCM76_15140 [Bacteroidota bacterium]